MAKSCNSDMLDAALNWVKNNVNIMHLCSAEPVDYTQASVTYSLGNVAIAGGDFTGPAYGDVSGRKITVGAKTDIVVTGDGDVTHVVLCDSVSSKLVYVQTCTLEAVTTGNLTQTSAWDIELRDPT